MIGRVKGTGVLTGRGEGLRLTGGGGEVGGGLGVAGGVSSRTTSSTQMLPAR